MKFHAALAAACLVAATAQAASPPTRRCNPDFGAGSVIVQASNPTTLAEIMAVANEPASNPELHARLWSPNGGGARGVDWGVLQYGFVQDVGEIAATLNADPLVTRGYTYRFSPNSYNVCFAVLLPAVPVTVTEYYNRDLAHYFLSSSPEENASIDGGLAGPGWERTGETFAAIKWDACHGAFPVFRFYGPGPNSHFFTNDPDECGAIRNHDPGWLYEGEAFGAFKPVAGACPGRTRPLYRLYNDRWAQDDSNHRFVARLDLYEAMKARGWVGEGVAMCLGTSASDTWMAP